MKQCIICGEKTKRPLAAVVEHFRPIDWSQRHYLRGNFKVFGFWSGLRANITLMFPIVNTLWNWKQRKATLDLQS
jgi:hypothetical protein